MPSPEPKGSGWRGVYRDAEGRRHKTPVVSSKAKAKRAAADMEAKVRSGKWIDPSGGRVTFADYFEKQWETTIKPSGIDDVEAFLNA